MRMFVVIIFTGATKMVTIKKIKSLKFRDTETFKSASW